jgi:transposase
MTKRISAKRFRIAVENTGGILTAIAKKLIVSRQTLYDWLAIEENKWANDLIHHEREKIIDIAESSLFSQTQEKQPWATKYVLSTLGKNRGYVEKQEIEHSSDQNHPIKIEVIMPNDNNTISSIAETSESVDKSD